LAPVFAVLLALALLGESIHLLQFLGITAIVAGVMFMYREQQQNLQRWSPWMLSLPLAAAVIRGAVQPVIKLGLEHWPSPTAAVVIGYTVSSAVLIVAAFVHDPKLVRRFDRRGALWFAAVGLCNGLSVLSLYAALGRGPVALVAPLVASYPLVTLLLSFVFLKHEHIGPPASSRGCGHSRWCCPANYRVKVKRPQMSAFGTKLHQRARRGPQR
jgi:drug/metabolite transporter (DMT)-like permease